MWASARDSANPRAHAKRAPRPLQPHAWESLLKLLGLDKSFDSFDNFGHQMSLKWPEKCMKFMRLGVQ